MKHQEKKSFSYCMRALHRDMGFFLIGLIMVFSLSGIVLIYRTSDFMKVAVQTERKIEPGLESADLAKSLPIRALKVNKKEGDILYFQDGSYNRSTGVATYTTREVIFPFNKFINFHKMSAKDPMSWVTTVFGILLLFMCISSFWMFKRGTVSFRRGLYLTGLGFILTLGLLLFL